MPLKPNPDRARQLAERGYDAHEIVTHMREESRNVGHAEVVAWLTGREPPVMVDWKGERITLHQLCRSTGRSYSSVQTKLGRGMTLEQALELHTGRRQVIYRAQQSPRGSVR